MLDAPDKSCEIIPLRYHYRFKMKSVLIRDIPDQTLAILKKRAKENHRSLQGELHALLSQATRNPEDVRGTFELKTVRTSGHQNWSREAIYEA